MQSSPKYVQVAQDILLSIENGRIGVGEILPSEAQLCAHYGVSRITVRAAMSNLRERGLVRRRPGVGTHVLRKEPSSRFVHTSDSVDSVLQFTESTHFHVLEQGWVEPGQLQDDSAGGRPGGESRRLRVVGLRLDPQELAICLSEFYFSPLHQSIIECLPGLKGSVILHMEKVFGVSLHAIEQVFDACKLTACKARLLQVRPGDAAMRVKRWHCDAKGDVLVQSINYYPSDRYTYKLRMQRKSDAGES